MKTLEQLLAERIDAVIAAKAAEQNILQIDAKIEKLQNEPVQGKIACAYFCKSNPEHLRWKIDIRAGIKQYLKTNITAVPTRDEAEQIIKEIDNFIK